MSKATEAAEALAEKLKGKAKEPERKSGLSRSLLERLLKAKIKKGKKKEGGHA